MTKKQKQILLALMVLVMIILNADGNVMAPTLVTIEAEFGVSDAQVGQMMGMFTIVGAIVSLLWGYFADKASRKLLFVLAVAIGEIPCLLSAFARSWTSFYVLRMLTGIGVGAAFPLVFSILGDIYDEKERPVTTAILATAFGFGNIVGTVVGGYLGPSLGWRIPFILISAPNFILLALFWVLVPEPQKAASEDATRELVAAGILYPRTIKLSDYAVLFKKKTNLYLLIQGIAGTVPWGAFFFLNKFLETEKGFDTGTATTIYLIFGIGMTLGTLAGGKFGGMVFKKSDRALPVFCAVTTVAGALGTFVVIAVDAGFAVLAALGFFTAFFAAMTGPNMKAMLLDVNLPEARGAIFSIFNLTDSLGTGIGRWVAGLLSATLGLSAALGISTAFWFLCGAVLFAARLIFPPDRISLHREMEAAAAEMKAAKAPVQE
jgi:predicted MFS family arabinose efflux permease